MSISITEAVQRHAVPEDVILKAITAGELPVQINIDDLDHWVNSLVISTIHTTYGPLTCRGSGDWFQCQMPVGLPEEQQDILANLLMNGL